jgi:hypothetical protein
MGDSDMTIEPHLDSVNIQLTGIDFERICGAWEDGGRLILPALVGGSGQRPLHCEPLRRNLPNCPARCRFACNWGSISIQRIQPLKFEQFQSSQVPVSLFGRQQRPANLADCRTSCIQLILEVVFAHMHSVQRFLCTR